MNKLQFWKLIDDARLKANGDLDKMHNYLLDALLELDAKSIYQWGEYYNNYHYLSDTTSLYMAAYVTNNGGDDSFEYFRGWLIAQGEKTYLAVLANPDCLADLSITTDDILSFEQIMSIGYEAYSDKLNETDELPGNYPLSDSAIDEIKATIILADDEGLESESRFFKQIAKRIPKLCRKFDYKSNNDYDSTEDSDIQQIILNKDIVKNSYQITDKYAYISEKASALPLLDCANSVESLQIQQNPELIDISALNTFTNLKRIAFEAYEEKFVELQDLNILSELPLLEDVSLSKIPQLSDISFLSKLTKLERLVISNMPELSDISVIQNLKHLKTLIIYDCPKLQEIPSLQASAESLTTVRFMNNKMLQSIEGLRGLHLLEDVWLNYNQLTDITPLEGIKQVTYLDLSQNKINSIEALSSLENVEDLILSHNKIVDISPLKNLRSAKNLFLSANKIKDITALSQLKFITYTLDLTKNKELSDLSPLKNVEIGGLDINRTTVTDFSSVSHIRYVDIRE